jgi:hypothetical protein
MTNATLRPVAQAVSRLYPSSEELHARNRTQIAAIECKAGLAHEDARLLYFHAMAQTGT